MSTLYQYNRLELENAQYNGDPSFSRPRQASETHTLGLGKLTPCDSPSLSQDDTAKTVKPPSLDTSATSSLLEQPETNHIPSSRSRQANSDSPEQEKALRAAPMINKRESYMSRCIYFLSSWSRRQPWLWESVSWLGALAMIIAIIAMLVRYDDRPIPSMRISLNALVSVLATISTFLMMVPVAAAIGQCKWLFVHQARRPLNDFLAIDGASKGLAGSFIVLAQWRGGGLAILGALLTVCVLAVGPFVQQVIAYRTHASQGPGATIPIVKAFSTLGPAGIDHPELPMNFKAAYYDGVLPRSRTNYTLDTVCTSGNCTWTSYSTLAICSQCDDITTSLANSTTESSTNLTSSLVNSTANTGGDATNNTYQLYSTAYMLPGGMQMQAAQSHQQTVLFNMSSSVVPLVFAGQGGRLVDIQIIDIIDQTPRASECVLYYCVKTFTANETVGHVLESPVGMPFTNDSADALAVPPAGAGCGSQADHILQPVRNGLVYTVDSCLRPFFDSLLQNLNGIVSLHKTLVVGSMSYSSTEAEAFYSALTNTRHNNHSFGLPSLMENLADSFTRQMRLVGGTTANGTVSTTEIYIHVTWEWLILPFALLLLSAAFPLLVVALSWRRNVNVWKTSTAATMFHGLDLDPQANDLAEQHTLDRMSERADEIRVKLRVLDKGWLLDSTFDAGL